MSDANFNLIFEGPAVDNGEIDIKDLAPSLLALGDLIQAANSQLNDGRTQVAVNLQATGKGSVVVQLSLVVSHALGLLDLLGKHKDGLSAANDLADIIFKVGAGTASGGGLFALLKWLRNRKPDKIETKGGDTYVHIGDTYFITNTKAIELAENLEVREQARKLVSVLESEGIKQISTQQPSAQKLTIDKTDVPAFEVPDAGEETLDDAEREVFLQIDSLSFKEGNKWRVTDGGEPFYAIIEDVDFLNRIAKNEISFAKNDMLHCLVKETQVRTGRGQLKKQRRIMKVLEHKPGVRQLKLL